MRTVHLLALTAFIAVLATSMLKPTLIDSIHAINQVLGSLPVR